MKPVPRESLVLTRVIKIVVAAAVMLGILGGFGAGYCQYKAAIFRTIQDRTREQTESVTYKGELRFVSIFDAKVCRVSEILIFAGAGSGLLIGLVFAAGFYTVHGRRPW